MRTAIACLLVLVVGGAVALGERSGDGREPRPERPATATAKLERRTLVERESVEGTLGYAGTRALVNRLAPGGGAAGSRSGGSATGGGSGSGGGSATITWLAGSGSVVRPGGVLYRLDDRPVVLMDGSVPAYRRLAQGVGRGPDVRQLERNLAALGHGAGMTVDDRFTSATATAVRRWQRAAGLPRTGAVELGRVVFLPGARRMGERLAAAGAAASDGTEVLTTSSTRRIVSVELDVAKQSLVRRGAGVRVTLPDGTEVSGRVASVGRAARAKDSGDGGSQPGDDSGSGDGSGDGSGGEDLVVDVSVALSSTRAARGLDRAPVTVDVARHVERGVLAAPVTALVARPGGGYALEVVDRAGRRRTVRVETGFFAGGYVAVTGRGLRAGTRVAVPE